MTRRFYPASTTVSDPDFEYRWRMCFRKIHYATEGDAKKAAKKKYKRPMRAYICPVHEPAHWHLTKSGENGNAAQTKEAAPTLATTSNPTPASGSTEATGTNRIKAIIS